MPGSRSTRRSRTRRSSAASAATRTSPGSRSGSTSRVTGCRTLERGLPVLGARVVVAGVEALDAVDALLHPAVFAASARLDGGDGVAPPARGLLLLGRVDEPFPSPRGKGHGAA